MKKWPRVTDLSRAKKEDIFSVWQGLGYYSRAENILRASKIISEEYNGKFPTTWSELIELPGIGPYTSRAISSICFEEPVGVVDGNVIRVFNRLLGEPKEWWNRDFHTKVQDFSDELAKFNPSSTTNQALMDLGATLCTPKNPACLLCPLSKNCLAFAQGNQRELPLPKPKKSFEHWLYKIRPLGPRQKLLPVSDEINAPVLKGKQLIFGKFKRLDKKPETYVFMHTITNNKIYVDFDSRIKVPPKTAKMSFTDLSRANPSSLMKKIWQHPRFGGTLKE